MHFIISVIPHNYVKWSFIKPYTGDWLQLFWCLIKGYVKKTILQTHVEHRISRITKTGQPTKTIQREAELKVCSHLQKKGTLGASTDNNFSELLSWPNSSHIPCGQLMTRWALLWGTLSLGLHGQSASGIQISRYSLQTCNSKTTYTN